MLYNGERSHRHITKATRDRYRHIRITLTHGVQPKERETTFIAHRSKIYHALQLRDGTSELKYDLALAQDVAWIIFNILPWHL